MNIVKMKALGAKEVHIESSFPLVAEGRLVSDVEAMVYKENLIIEISCHETQEQNSRIIKYKTSFELLKASEYGKNILNKDYYEMSVRGDDDKLKIVLIAPSYKRDFDEYKLSLEVRLSYKIAYTYSNKMHDSHGVMYIGSNGNKFLKCVKEESSGRYIAREIDFGSLSKFTLDIWIRNTRYNEDFLILDKQGNTYYIDVTYGEHKTISLGDAPKYNEKIYFDKDNMKVYCKYIDAANWIKGVGDEVKVLVYEPKKVDRNNYKNIFNRDGIMLLEEVE